MSTTVECSVTLNDAANALNRTETVEGDGRNYYGSLAAVLGSVKEEVNSVLTEEVVKEKQRQHQPDVQPLKRPSEEDSEGIYVYT